MYQQIDDSNITTDKMSLNYKLMDSWNNTVINGIYDYFFILYIARGSVWHLWEIYLKLCLRQSRAVDQDCFQKYIIGIHAEG